MTIKLPFFSRPQGPRLTNKQRVVLSAAITPNGRHVAEGIMTDDGIMLERLFNYIGELEGRINSLSCYVHSRQPEQD